MKRDAISCVALVAAVLVLALAAGTGATGDAAGRYKKQGDRCVWDANDSGPDQCTPAIRGRFKKEGDACVWRNDPGEDQCRPAKGRFKKVGQACRWDANESGRDQCDPRHPR